MNKEQITNRTGAVLSVGILLIATSMFLQKTLVTIKDALSDSGKLRQTVDRCNESGNSNDPHFTGCSSIL